MNTGYLEIIMGPMFSGKTTRLIDIYHRYREKGYNVCAINYLHDTRYGNKLTTHDQRSIDCIHLEHIWELSLETIQKHQVFLINEAQFFNADELYEVVIKLVEHYHKYVFICGLDGTFKRESFKGSGLFRLIPMADAAYKLTAKCMICEDNASFTRRLVNNRDEVLIGTDEYQAVCRKCYKNNPIKHIDL